MVDVMKAELMQQLRSMKAMERSISCTEGFLTGGYGHKILPGKGSYN